MVRVDGLGGHAGVGWAIIGTMVIKQNSASRVPWQEECCVNLRWTVSLQMLVNTGEGSHARTVPSNYLYPKTGEQQKYFLVYI